MRFSCLSLFPELIEAYFHSSVMGRARDHKCFELCSYQIRDFAINDYGKVDDALYGGGTGMLMMAEPIYQAVEKAREMYRKEHGEAGKERVIYLSPRGDCLSQEKAASYLKADHLILICGHYEGVDQRVLDELDAEECSIGDYVLSGGELPAAVLIDVCARMIPGVLPDASAWQEDSHAQGLLEADQYTRPETWRNRNVPPVYLSGHAARIQEAKRRSSLLNTLRSRPELLEKADLDESDYLLLAEQMKAEKASGTTVLPS